ncbi:NUDIX domain-containing protein [Burkholderiales bacterium 8X]|nr:NUDIX domain-containing protein [Burkholderiales bacterium 8X]
MQPASIQKACACLVDAQGRLLVFHHPGDRSMQLPKGTIEPGETPERAVRRELHEESGIDFGGPLQSLGTLDRDGEIDAEGQVLRHAQLWHLFLMRATDPLPERFDHVAWGSPEEQGLVFSFSWLALDVPADGFATPYAVAIGRVREALRP